MPFVFIHFFRLEIVNGSEHSTQDRYQGGWQRIFGDVQYGHKHIVYSLKTGMLKLQRDGLTHHNDTTRNR